MNETPIGELHGLLENDPWQNPSKAKTTEADTIGKRIFDRLEKEGHFDEKPFVDPPNDDDPTIVSEGVWTVFWRLTVDGRKLSEIIAMEPSIRKISMAFKNTSTGCWIAFTGKRIASKIETVLNAQGIVTSLLSCDGGATSVVSREAEGYYYCIGEYDRKVKAYFVPIAYWNDHETACDIELDEMLGYRFKPTEVGYCYEAMSRDVLATKAFLDHVGFRENLLFQAFINERTGE